MNKIEKSEAEGFKPYRFFVGKDYIRKIDIPDSTPDSTGTIRVYHLYPLMEHWLAGELLDDVNPRSHENVSLTARIPKDIRETIINSPEAFYLANRGITVLAEDLRYDPNKQIVDLVITSKDGHGLADGATTDRVIAKLKDEISSENREYLESARVHVEVIIGLHEKDIDRIHSLVRGRNTSIQVKSWSLADFRHVFDWLKNDILESESSPVRGKIGYDENAQLPTNIFDVLSILTLFIHYFDEKTGSRKANQKAPTVAYSSKGTMDKRFEKNVDYYKDLRPIIIDILKLYEYVYSKFVIAYSDSRGGKHRLGARPGVVNRAIILPLTGCKSDYTIPSGLIFPLVASLRALVEYDQSGLAHWKMDPFKFFDVHGGELVARLNELWEAFGNNPNTCGKKPLAYTSIHERAQNLVLEQSQN